MTLWAANLARLDGLAERHQSAADHPVQVGVPEVWFTYCEAVTAEPGTRGLLPSSPESRFLATLPETMGLETVPALIECGLEDQPAPTDWPPQRGDVPRRIPWSVVLAAVGRIDPMNRTDCWAEFLVRVGCRSDVPEEYLEEAWAWAAPRAVPIVPALARVSADEARSEQERHQALVAAEVVVRRLESGSQKLQRAAYFLAQSAECSGSETTPLPEDLLALLPDDSTPPEFVTVLEAVQVALVTALWDLAVGSSAPLVFSDKEADAAAGLLEALLLRVMENPITTAEHREWTADWLAKLRDLEPGVQEASKDAPREDGQAV